ncbi:MAG: glycosyltransferase, partial [Leptospirales bacterium]
MAQESVYLIIAGGTGGHIVPGLGLALEFAAAGDAVHFLSLEKNRAYADFKDASFPVHFYAAPPLSKRPLALVTFPFRFARALWRAWRLLREQAVSCVVGMGGYSIFPGIVAARLSGVPYYLCEQNAVPGRATRLFAGGARRVYLNFPVRDAQLSAAFSPARALLAGNPLRPQLKAIAGTPEGSAQIKSRRNKSTERKKQSGAGRSAQGEAVARGQGGLTVLVLGGSQGAAQINAMVAAAIPELDGGPRAGSGSKKKSGPIDRWIIQCGERNLEAMRALLPPERFRNV